MIVLCARLGCTRLPNNLSKLKLNPQLKTFGSYIRIKIWRNLRNYSPICDVGMEVEMQKGVVHTLKWAYN